MNLKNCNHAWLDLLKGVICRVIHCFSSHVYFSGRSPRAGLETLAGRIRPASRSIENSALKQTLKYTIHTWTIFKDLIVCLYKIIINDNKKIYLFEHIFISVTRI